MQFGCVQLLHVRQRFLFLVLVTVEAVNICVDGVITALVVTAGWEVVRIVVDDRGALMAVMGREEVMAAEGGRKEVTETAGGREEVMVVNGEELTAVGREEVMMVNG